MGFLSTLSAVLLIFTGCYFTFAFRAFYLRRPIRTLRMMPMSNGIKQMLLSLGGTVGVGNISGVAVAIMLGGAGAVFWMWVGAFFAMALKCAEITLGMFYRHGASHYIKQALGSVAATIFTLLLVADVITMGGMIQASAISEAVFTAYGISPLVSGVTISVLAATVFFFKIDLFRLSAYVVPIMSVGYTIASLSVIALFLNNIPNVLSSIFKSAFCFDSAIGGVLGFVFTPAFRQGMVKGLFSNEAGCGTAPLAHAASCEKSPAKQGLFGILEVFIDTLLMCTLTAFVILLTLGSDIDNHDGGVGVCVRAFKSLFGGASASILALFVFLFAFSAIVSFGYYGTQCLSFFNCSEKGKNLFLIVFCMALLAGAVATPTIVWSIADAVICVMLLINTTAVFIFRKSIIKAHYTHIGKYSHNASKTRSCSSGRMKKEIPMSDTEIKRGSTL
ncbi:MAG: sodium:alanine symporter family protein [Clostridia bacterium]|nr:sodium:alanine symporter family protein [Clostridia bacterium]